MKSKVARSDAEGRPRPEQRAILALSGQACELYHVDVEAALRKVSGVRDVDLQTMKGHAILTIEAGVVSPGQLLAAVSSVHGPDYSCKGKLVSQ
jgi:copper chaperone CopZ